jgi:hypothetical protein
LICSAVVLALQILHYRFVHFVAGYANGTGINDTAHGNDGNIGGAAADIHNHVSGGLFNGQSRADGRGHGLLDEIDLAGARAIGGVLHGAFFDGSDFAGHADDDARMNEHAAVVRFLNEVGKHLLGDFEVGDDAIFHRLDGDDVAGSAAEHFFRFAADGDDFSGGFVDGDDRGFVDNNAFSGGEHQRVGGSKVDGEVGRK